MEEFFVDDWALRRFAGVSNLPAVPRALPAAALAAYEGGYVAQQVGPDGELQEFGFQLVADGGRLVMTQDGVTGAALAFYRRDRVLLLDPAGEPLGFQGGLRPRRRRAGRVAQVRRATAPARSRHRRGRGSGGCRRPGLRR